MSTSSRATNETRTERVARILIGLVANEFTGEDWKKARDLWTDRDSLSIEDRYTLEDLVIKRDYQGLKAFLAGKPKAIPALKGSKVFWSSMYALLVMAVMFPLAVISSPFVFVYKNIGYCLRASWNGVKKVVECCGWLLVTVFIGTVSLVWYVLTKGAWFVFDQAMSLFGKFFLGNRGPPVGNAKQCPANHTTSANQTKTPPQQAPECCSNIDVEKIFEKNPAFKQMLIEKTIAGVQAGINKRLDVWTPRIAEDQAKQNARILQLEKDMKEQEARMREYDSKVRGVAGIAEALVWVAVVYGVCKFTGYAGGNTRFLNTVGGAQLRAATELAQAREVLDATLGRVGGEAVRAAAEQGVGQLSGWLSWDAVKTAGISATKFASDHWAGITSVSAAFTKYYMVPNSTIIFS